MDSVNTRELVLDILMSVTRDHVLSHIALCGVLDKYHYLSKQDRAFITRLSEGTIERIIELDYILDCFSKTPVRKMKPVIRNILRMGVYQLKYMDSVPDRAACNEAVRLAEQKGFYGLKGFVNGVLRNTARRLNQVVYPDPDTDLVQYLSVRYSMPHFIVSNFLDMYGLERCERILAAFLQERPLTVRTELTRISTEELKTRLRQQGICLHEVPGPSYAFGISGFDSPDEIPEFNEGYFYVQDTASMAAAELAGPKPGDTVIDVCAAPGGKSLHCFSLMNGNGMVEARDLTERKTNLIRENFERMFPDQSGWSVTEADASVFDPASVGRADVLIADLPCSGLGVIGTKPDIKYRVTPESIRELAGLQRQILGTVHSYVRPGGVLLYSTCTMTKEENEDNTAWFLRTYPQFQLEKTKHFFPDEGCSGFYMAKMRCAEDIPDQDF